MAISDEVKTQREELRLHILGAWERATAGMKPKQKDELRLSHKTIAEDIKTTRQIVGSMFNGNAPMTKDFYSHVAGLLKIEIDPELLEEGNPILTGDKGLGLSTADYQRWLQEQIDTGKFERIQAVVLKDSDDIKTWKMIVEMKKNKTAAIHYLLALAREKHAS